MMRARILTLCVLSIGTLSQALSGFNSFSTGGHTVYHLRPATIETDKRTITSATYDGSVLCHRRNGKLIWNTSIGRHFPFDMAVADIDADGRDETLVATGAGKLYALDDNGEILWVFDQLDCYWAGSELPAHDFSRFGLGINRRMCNFLPTTPYGLIPIIPYDVDIEHR